MQIFNKKDNNEIVNLVNDLKLIQERINILINEREKVSMPPLNSFITSYEKKEVLDYLIPITTGYYTLEDVKKDRINDKEKFLEGLKQIGTFLMSFSDGVEQYENISGQIKELKQQENAIKRKLGIT